MKLLKNAKLSNQILETIREVNLIQIEKIHQHLEKHSEFKTNTKDIKDNFIFEKTELIEIEKNSYESLINDMGAENNNQIIKLVQMLAEKDKEIEHLQIKKNEESNFDKEKMREEFEQQKKVILKDMKNKIDTISKQNDEIKKYKEKNEKLENSMTNGQKEFTKKMKGLESNVENLTVLYTQLINQRNQLKSNNHMLEKKIQRRNDTIKLFEKKVNDLQDDCYYYKSKYETLKTMVCQNEFGPELFVPGLMTDNPEKTSSPRKKTYEKEPEKRVEFANNEPIKENILFEQEKQKLISNLITPQNKRIVKHVRGGQCNIKMLFFSEKFQ